MDISEQVAAYDGPPVEVWYADPAWKFRANRTDLDPGALAAGRNAARHYKTMTLAQIKAIPVAEKSAAQAVCFLWITGPFMAIGEHVSVLKAWGYKPKAIGFTWVKLRKNAPGLFMDPKLDLHVGLGLTTRKNAEFCIIGTRGLSMRKSAKVHEVGLFPLREHSRKPDEFRQRIEEYVGPGKTMVELFARQAAPGWIAMGDEAGKFPGAK
jgi:N6-adenosine-specific RNA methylase IME4